MDILRSLLTFPKLLKITAIVLVLAQMLFGTNWLAFDPGEQASSPSSVYAAECGGEEPSVPTGVEQGKYGANQVFDVQRSPAYPVADSNFTLSSMADPYSNVTNSQYTIGAGQYIQFFYNGGSCNENADNIGIKLYNSNGSVAATIAENGTVYGIGDEGFLHVSAPGGYGTFISNLEGFSHGDSLTYVPETAEATCVALENYQANPTVLGDGETSDPCNFTVESSAVCGDGTVDEGEVCDDGNTDTGDGCDDSCALETGYECSEAGSGEACGSGGEGSVVVSCVSEDDCDGDGVDDTEEEGSPLGTDVDGDGKDDSRQSHIVTAIDPIIGAHTTTVVEGCADATTTVAFYHETDLTGSDSDYDYDLGLHGFNLACGITGQTVDVTYYWDQVYDTSSWTYRKYMPTTETFIDFDEEVTYGTATPLSGITVTTVSFSITDGGPYDGDGLANGVIVDPTGPAVVVVDTGGGSTAHTSTKTTTSATTSVGTGDSSPAEEPEEQEEQEETTDEIVIEPTDTGAMDEEETEYRVGRILDTIKENNADTLNHTGTQEITLPVILPKTGASL